VWFLSVPLDPYFVAFPGDRPHVIFTPFLCIEMEKDARRGCKVKPKVYCIRGHEGRNCIREAGNAKKEYATWDKKRTDPIEQKEIYVRRGALLSWDSPSIRIPRIYVGDHITSR
jgi:hypothetical protein